MNGANQTPHPVCPNNFPSAQKIPRLHDIVAFEIRVSDTIPQDRCAALIQYSPEGEKLFLGWIKREHKERFWPVWQRNWKLEGKVQSLGWFDWQEGGGQCWRGTVHCYGANGTREKECFISRRPPVFRQLVCHCPLCEGRDRWTLLVGLLASSFSPNISKKNKNKNKNKNFKIFQPSPSLALLTPHNSGLYRQFSSSRESPTHRQYIIAKYFVSKV